jgi:serine protease
VLHRLLRGRVAPGLMAVPLVVGVAVPSALSFLDQPEPLPRLGLLAEALGPGDGLERFVVTVARDLPPRKAGGARESTWSGPPTYDENIAALSSARGVEVVVPLGGDRAMLAVQDGTSARTLPFVRSAEPAVELTPFAATAPTDPYFAYSWGLQNTGRNPVWPAKVAGADVDALTAWEHSRGAGVVVAVIDNGYDTSHPDLASALWTNPDESCDPAVDLDGNGYKGDCHGWNLYRNNNDVANLYNGQSLGSHGTPVSGIAAAQIDNAADIINMSFGGPSDVTSMREAMQYAADRGVLMVAAAGNDGGVNRDVAKTYPNSYVFPELLSVGSSNASDAIASHSDYGPSTVHLFAPGEAIAVAMAGGGLGIGDGTSFAAPISAAAAALVMAARPDLPAPSRRPAWRC